MTGVELCIVIKASLAWLSPYQEGVACDNAAYIIQQSEKRDVDPLIVAAIIYRESAFSPRVVSNAGACGLTQVIPKYSKYTCEQLKQPRVAIREGVRALAKWLSWAGGDMDNALCGYNAGTRCIKSPQGRFARKVKRRYVKRVMESYSRLRDGYDKFDRERSKEAQGVNAE